MDRKNLLVLVPSLGIGGQERVAINTANILKGDYNIFLAIFNQQKCNYEFNGTLINLELPPVCGTLNKIMNVFLRARALKKIKREYKIDVTLSLGSSANFVNALSKASDKVMVSVHAYNSLNQSYWAKMIHKRTYEKADTVITVARKIAIDLAEFYQIPDTKIKTLNNPYDIAAIMEGANEPIGMPVHSPSIVSIGRMHKVKGFRHLINAMADVVSSIPNAKLFLVGDGEEMPILQEYAQKKGLRDHIIFVGFQSNPYSYEGKCDLYVLSSINEGFPNTLVEALACGLPVVATDCKTGPREILMEHFEDITTNGIEYADYGVLVPPFIADESCEYEKDKLLAQAIIEMLTNQERSNNYKERAIERAKAFSFPIYREKLLRIIEE